MRKSSCIISGKIIVMISMAIIFSNCRTSSYITDKDSRQQQKMIRRYRTGINFSDVMIQVGSVVTSATTGLNIYASTELKSFRKLRLMNESRDTLFVNMVTDCRWRDSTFCDIKDIVIPPLKSARLITPLGAIYNVYYRKEFEAPDDEKIEINTAENKIIRLGGEMAKRN